MQPEVAYHVMRLVSSLLLHLLLPPKKRLPQNRTAQLPVLDVCLLVLLLLCVAHLNRSHLLLSCVLTTSAVRCPSVPRKVLTSEWGHIVSHLGIFPKGHALDLANATLGETESGGGGICSFPACFGGSTVNHAFRPSRDWAPLDFAPHVESPTTSGHTLRICRSTDKEVVKKLQFHRHGQLTPTNGEGMHSRSHSSSSHTPLHAAFAR